MKDSPDGVSMAPLLPVMVPRAKRFPVAIRVLWRPRGVTEWFESESVNASRTGVLFRSQREIAVGTEVELLLPIGEENVASAGAADVLCAGRIVRATEGADGAAMAATIETYMFLREP
jgi:hypothetical protein